MKTRAKTFEARYRWNDKYPTCKNCGTTRYERRLKGYCERCSRPAELLRKMDTWDPSNMDTWKGSGFERLSARPRNAAKFFTDSRDVIADRLRQLRHYESVIRGDERVDDLAFEHLLEEIAKILRLKRKGKFTAFATAMAGPEFSQEQRRGLYRWLTDFYDDVAMPHGWPWTIALRLATPIYYSVLEVENGKPTRKWRHLP
jgi:hypothetical protein